MQKATIAARPLALDAAALLSIGVVSVVVANSAIAAQQPGLMGPAIAIDLTLTAGLIHFLVGVRAGGLPKWTLAPVMIAGALLAAALVPASAFPLDLLVIGSSAIELCLLGVAAVRVRSLYLGAKAARAEGKRGLEVAEAALRQALPFAPGVARWAMLEAGVFLFALTGWVRRTPTGEHLFSHHRKTNWTPLALTFAGLSVVEGGLVHLLLISNGWMLGAWIAGILHLSGLSWILGDMHAVRLRPTRLEDDHLAVSIGLRVAAHIPRATIVSATVGEWDRKDIGEDAVHGALMGAATLRLRLSAPTPVRTLFKTQQTSELYLQIDDANLLAETLAPALDA